MNSFLIMLYCPCRLGILMLLMQRRRKSSVLKPRWWLPSITQVPLSTRPSLEAVAWSHLWFSTCFLWVFCQCKLDTGTHCCCTAHYSWWLSAALKCCFEDACQDQKMSSEFIVPVWRQEYARSFSRRKKLKLLLAHKPTKNLFIILSVNLTFHWWGMCTFVCSTRLPLLSNFITFVCVYCHGILLPKLASCVCCCCFLQKAKHIGSTLLDSLQSALLAQPVSQGLAASAGVVGFFG